MRGKDLHCFFVDLKNVFTIVAYEKLWRRMDELWVPSQYMLVISRIYEIVICCVHMSLKNSLNEHNLVTN